jgi:hypothetical protein
MKLKCLRLACVGCAFASSAFSALAQQSPPTPPTLPDPSNLPDPPYAIITYIDTGSTVVAPAAGRIFPLVGLQPDQKVQITVQFSLLAQGIQGQFFPIGLGPNGNAPIIQAQALDGGTINGWTPDVTPADVNPGIANLPVSNSGTITFTFQAAHDPGINQIALRQGSRAMGLQFWVLGPQNNPPAITPADPSNY